MVVRGARDPGLVFGVIRTVSGLYDDLRSSKKGGKVLDSFVSVLVVLGS